jgi:hypothetical protein
MKRWVIPFLFLAMAGVLGFSFWQIHGIKGQVADLRWDLALQDRNDDSVITPDVGTIQFLKRGGYSIQLEIAKYGGDGLYLQGFVGNPTNIWISNLSLKFSVTKNLYEYRTDFDKDPTWFFFSVPTIGEAQCSPITTLSPGGRQPFEVSIPNVKQTKEGLRIAVAFTGERYSYSP